MGEIGQELQRTEETQKTQEAQKIEEILETYVRPQLHEHGGDVYVTDIRERVVYVKFTGHCSGCPSAKYTLESVIKEELLKHTDEVSDVRLVEEVSQELYDFAKAILTKSEKK